MAPAVETGAIVRALLSCPATATRAGSADAVLDALLVHGVFQHRGVLVVLADIAGQREDEDREGHQHSENDAEYVEKVGIVLLTLGVSV